jgi:hypothetical protein
LWYGSIVSATHANGNGGWCYVGIYRPFVKGRNYLDFLMFEIHRNLEDEKKAKVR